MIKYLENYFKKHPHINSATHFLIGLGAGVLMARPWFGPHPLRWGLALLGIGLAVHIYPLLTKKKGLFK